MAVDKKGTKQVTANKKAWHDYFVEEKYEAGIELAGTEVMKSSMIPIVTNFER